MFNLYTQRLIARLAIFAMLFAAFAPSISHAMSTKTSLEQLALQQICRASNLYGVSSNQDFSLTSPSLPTSQNMKALGNPQPNSMPPMDGAQHFEHCPFCGQHVAQWVLPTVSLQLFLVVINAPEHLVVVDAPVSSAFVHFTPPSQAPPVL